MKPGNRHRIFLVYGANSCRSRELLRDKREDELALLQNRDLSLWRRVFFHTTLLILPKKELDTDADQNS